MACGRDAVEWLMEEKKVCLFRWYHGISERREWLCLTNTQKLVFRRITKVHKYVVWSRDLICIWHMFFYQKKTCKLWPGIKIRGFEQLAEFSSGGHGKWAADRTLLCISRFHCTGTNHFRRCDYTFQNADPDSDATWHMTSGGPGDGVPRRLLYVP